VSANLSAQFQQSAYTLVLGNCTEHASICSAYTASNYSEYTFFIDGSEVSQPRQDCGENGSLFEFEVGSHNIEAYEGETLHSSAEVTVLCAAAGSSFEDFDLFIPTAIEVCPDVSALGGPIETISIEPDTRFVDVTIGSNGCLDVMPEAVGVDSVSIIYCDGAGTCDSAQYRFNAMLSEPIVSSTIYDTIPAPGSTVTYCIDTLQLPGNVVSVMDICAEEGTFVEFTLTELTVCTKYRGLQAGGTDSTCVVVCDDLGFCDTTTVIVTTIEPTELPEINLEYTVELNQATSRALDISMFDEDAIAGMENVCSQLSGTFVDFSLELSNYSVDFAGLRLGTERACVEIFDTDGLRQRYNVTVTVVPVVPRRDTIRIRNGDTRRWCFPDPDIEGAIVTIYDGCTPEASIVETATTDIDRCVDLTGLDLGDQEVCITVCDDEDNCDVFTLFVEVVPNDDDRLPIARDDAYVTDPSDRNVVLPLENDESSSEWVFAQIVDGPRFGQAFFNGAFELTYTLGNNPCQNDTLIYEVCNRFGCDQAQVVFFNDCGLDKPDLIVRGGISPNGDGVNDDFIITNIEFYPDSELKIYNRWGSRIYETRGYHNDWTATFDGTPIPDGTYFYFIDLREGDEEPIAGYIQVRR